MKSVLVVCYSYSGVSRRAAQLLASHLGWPLGEVLEQRSRAGFGGDLRCVLDSLLRRRPAIRYEGPEPADFDAVVVVSPIWAMQMAGPMRSFLAEYAGRMKCVAQVTTMSAAGAANAVAEATRLLHRAPVLSVGLMARELEVGAGTTRLLAFGEALAAASETQAPQPREFGAGDVSEVGIR